MGFGINIIIMSTGENLSPPLPLSLFFVRMFRGHVKSEEPLFHEAGGGPAGVAVPSAGQKIASPNTLCVETPESAHSCSANSYGN